MKHYWTWGGTYFGYINQAHLFTYNGKCVGRVKDNNIYGFRGEYLGEIQNDFRLITHKVKKNSRGPAAIQHSGSSYVPYVNCVGRIMCVGYEDFPEPSSFHVA